MCSLPGATPPGRAANLDANNQNNLGRQSVGLFAHVHARGGRAGQHRQWITHDTCACSAVPVVRGESAHQFERSGLRMVRRHHKKSVCPLEVQRGSAIRAQGGDETETRARAGTLGGKGRAARGVPGVEATRVAALTSEIRSVSPSVASEPPRAREKSEPIASSPCPENSPLALAQVGKPRGLVCFFFS